MSPLWRELLVNIAVGTVAGGVTNAIAVWMLFHPYERKLGLHGAIPKNKARLAKSIGRTVGEKLLTPTDLLDELTRAGFRETLDTRVTAMIREALETERGPLRELLPAAILPEVERAISELGPIVAAGIGRYVTTPEFEDRVRQAVTRLRAEMHEVPVSGMLTPERRQELAAQAATLATELIEEARKADGRSATAKIGDLLLKLAGAERTRGFVERTVSDALAKAEHRSWGDVLEAVDDPTLVRWLCEAARSPRIEALASEAAAAGAGVLLDKPIGRPGRFLPDEAAARIAAAATPALWGWLESQLPRLVEQLDIPQMVERKVLGFSTRRIEEIIRNVTQKELTMIVNLGYLLGAMIGVLTFVGQRLFN